MTIKRLKKDIQKLEEQLVEHKELKQLINIKEDLEKQLSKERKINWKIEAPLIKTLALEGKTLQEIGDRYEVSKEMIRQVLLKNFPDLTKEKRGIAISSFKKREHLLESLYARTGRKTGKHQNDLSRAMARSFSQKKSHAKSGKWEWTITPADLEYPLVCPMLGITLDWFKEYRDDSSPSFDRINSNLGYIPGNVVVCSWRANRIKNDGTAKELRQIADYLDNREKVLDKDKNNNLYTIASQEEGMV